VLPAFLWPGYPWWEASHSANAVEGVVSKGWESHQRWIISVWCDYLKWMENLKNLPFAIAIVLEGPLEKFQFFVETLLSQR
jgi:hypothetical protein